MGKLGHFTQAVYLITMYDSKGRRGGGSVLAVNIADHRKLTGNQPLQTVEDKMPMARGVMVSPLRTWQQKCLPTIKGLFGTPHQQGAGAGVFNADAIDHYLGGPVEPAHPFALVEMAKSEEILGRSTKPEMRAMLQRFRIKNEMFFGDVETLLSIIAEYVKLATARGSPEDGARAGMKIFWGYASWDGTQLLGEIARCGWGLVAGSDHLGMLSTSWDVASTWDQIVDTGVVAKESEYSRS